jgi:hypothetical protein
MSATDRTASAMESANTPIAHVNFRVRCETLGHGEEVFLVAAANDGVPVNPFAVRSIDPIGCQEIILS